MNKQWTPTSWRDFPIKQVPVYPNLDELREVEKHLADMPGIVGTDEIDQLKSQLALAAKGKAFIVQGGDCAESFSEFGVKKVTDTYHLLGQMAQLVSYGSQKPVIKIGRIGGQFAKPRSSDFEVKDGLSLPSFRGEIINGFDFSTESRVPDPQRMLTAYTQSVSTVNLLSGFQKASALAVEGMYSQRNVNFVNSNYNTPAHLEYVTSIAEVYQYLQNTQLDTSTQKVAPLFTSHESLLLNYEEPLVRQGNNGLYYGTSGHFLWIGARTHQIDHAHVHFLSGLENPIGIKCSPNMDPKELIQLLDKLDPQNVAGRITLISRMGHKKVKEGLTPLVQAVQESGHEVVWMCDPMHGNTHTSESGYKTRDFNDILSEINGFFDVLAAEGAHAGGIHLELTGEAEVTECLGAQNVTDETLPNKYRTVCDPRLNREQSLQMAFLVSKRLKQIRKSKAGDVAVSTPELEVA